MKERVEIKVNYDDVRVTVNVDKKRYVDVVADAIATWLQEDVNLYDEEVREELTERYECGEFLTYVSNFIESWVDDEFMEEARTEFKAQMQDEELENSCWGEI